MKKVILLVGLLACGGAWATTLEITDVKKDGFGNTVTYANVSDGDKRIFTDGSKTVGKFATTSVLAMIKEKQAGYGVIPAKNFKEMMDNQEFGKSYTVDCQEKIIKDENTGQSMRISDMNNFHQTAAKEACTAFEEQK